MNKQKKGIVALTLVLLAVIGIGFAASQNTLNITGTTSAMVDFKIVYDTTNTPQTSAYNSTPSNALSYVTVNASYTDEDDATISVEGLKNAGDMATVAMFIKNQSKYVDGTVDINVTLPSGFDSTHYAISKTLIPFDTATPATPEYAPELAYTNSYGGMTQSLPVDSDSGLHYLSSTSANNGNDAKAYFVISIKLLTEFSDPDDAEAVQHFTVSLEGTPLD